MKATVYIGTSLDGFIARKDGDIDWLTQFANDEAIRVMDQSGEMTKQTEQPAGFFCPD